MSDTLLTLFTAPKAFKDPLIVTIQRNALYSWKALGDNVNIIVFGNDEGVGQHSRELGLRHLPDVTCNSYGTPLISSMLNLARDASSSPYLGIVNTDILLFSDILNAVRKAADKLNKFLLLGQRWDMEISSSITTAAQLTKVKESIPSTAVLHPPMGSDYFIFPRDCFTAIPDFAIGRAGWDNWFIFKSRLEGWPVIDCTHDAAVVHQTHDYRHLPGGQPHYRLPETKLNVDLGGGDHTIFTLFDAQYKLVNGSVIKPGLSLKKVLREIEISPLTRLRSLPLGRLFYFAAHPKRAYAEFRKNFLTSKK